MPNAKIESMNHKPMASETSGTLNMTSSFYLEDQSQKNYLFFQPLSYLTCKQYNSTFTQTYTYKLKKILNRDIMQMIKFVNL